MDSHRAELAVRELLIALDQDVESEGLKDTPERVARMFIEQCTEKDAEIDRVFSEKHFGGMVIVRNIPFVSMCTHHLVHFSGQAHVGYIPRKRVLGISKLARLVYSCSVGFTTQEHITNLVAEALYDDDDLGCLGVAVILEAQHGCMNLRGARTLDSTTITSEMRGVFMTVPAAREEFLALIRDKR